MDLIEPPELPAVLMGKDAMPIQVNATIELGVFGVYVGTAEKDIVNTCPGHLVRTKAATSREIGVAVGLGFIDSPLLV
jgi:glutathione synthase